MDDVTIKNLELFASSYEGSEKYSLAHLLDTTRTSGGSRLIRYLIANPINDLDALQWRVNNIEYYVENKEAKEMDATKIHQLMTTVSDIPKLVSMLLYKKLNPSVFIKIRATLRIFFETPLLLQELTRL